MSAAPRRLYKPYGTVYLVMYLAAENKSDGRKTGSSRRGANLPHTTAIIGGGIGRQLMFDPEKTDLGIVGVLQLLLDGGHGVFPPAGRIAVYGKLHIGLPRTEPHFPYKDIFYLDGITTFHGQRAGFGRSYRSNDFDLPTAIGSGNGLLFFATP